MLYQIIYAAYDYSSSLCDLTGQILSPFGYKVIILLYLLEKFSFFALLYGFRGAALYKMAKNKGIKESYLAFIPFAFFILLGKLQPSGKYNAKFKNFFIIALIFVSVGYAINIAIDIIFVPKPLSVLLANGTLQLTDFVSNSFLLTALEMFESIISLGGLIFSLIAYANVYKSYAPQCVRKYTLLTILVYIFTGSMFLAGILLFVNRNANPIDFDNYIDCIRRRYYYNSSYNMHKKYNDETHQQNTADDPFSEFSKSDDDPFSDFYSSTDTEKNNQTNNSNCDNNNDADDLF